MKEMNKLIIQLIIDVIEIIGLIAVLAIVVKSFFI